MALDDKFDVVEKLIATDERQQPLKLVKDILDQIKKVPGAGPLVELVLHESEKQKLENTELLLETMWSELKRLSSDFERLRPVGVRREDVRRLVVDSLHKAEDLRDRKRVERIGKILASAISLEPNSDFDKAEEMMRVARDLSDEDVRMLTKLSHGQIPVQIQPTEDDSILLKLQGLGLARRLEREGRSDFYQSPSQPPRMGMSKKIEMQLPQNLPVFVLLTKGRDFIQYVEGMTRQ